MTKSRSRIDALLEAFFSGVGFPVLVMLSVLLGYSYPPLDLPVILFVSLCVAVGMLRYRTVNVLLSFVFMIFYVVNPAHSPNFPHFSEYYKQPIAIAVIALGSLIVLGSLFVFCIRNRREANPWTRASITVFISLLLLAAAFTLSGMGASQYVVADTVYGACLSLSFLVFYFVFVRYLKPTSELRTLVMQNMVFTELLISVQVLLLYLTNDKIFKNGEIVKGEIITGWGTWGTIGCMLVMMMPACFYLAAVKKNGILYFLVGMLGFGATVLSMSRSAWLVGAFILAVSLLLYFRYSPYRVRAVLSTLFVLLLGVAAVIVLREKLAELFFTNVNLGMSDNGRFEIWEYGLQCFKASPIFGAGFYSNEAPEGWTLLVAPALYHNTFLQLLAASGIFALLFYLYHRGVTLYYAFRRTNLFRIFLVLGAVGMLLGSLVDNFLFMIFPTAAYAILLAVGALDADHSDMNADAPKSEKQLKEELLSYAELEIKM